MLHDVFLCEVNLLYDMPCVKRHVLVLLSLEPGHAPVHCCIQAFAPGLVSQALDDFDSQLCSTYGQFSFAGSALVLACLSWMVLQFLLFTMYLICRVSSSGIARQEGRRP